MDNDFVKFLFMYRKLILSVRCKFFNHLGNLFKIASSNDEEVFLSYHFFLDFKIFFITSSSFDFSTVLEPGSGTLSISGGRISGFSFQQEIHLWF